MDRPTHLILAAKAVRTFCYGFMGVILPVHLAALGLGAEGIGITITLTLGGTAAMTLAARRPTERLGPRVVLIALATLIVLSGVIFATSRNLGLVVAAAVLGNLAVSVGESGPFLSIEQVLVARAVTGDGLTMAMSLYNLVGYAAAALGALVMAALAQGNPGGEPGTVPGPLLFWLFAASGAVQVLLYRQLAPPTITERSPSARPRPSRGFIYRVAALFGLDALAGGFVVQSLIAYWFFVHFGLDLPSLGVVFFGAQALTAVSFLIAARAAGRFGLVNTMVVSHLLSNVLLIGMAVAPSASVAVGLLLARHLLSQMDVPTRQAFLMSVVEDREREAAATITNASRTVAQSISPALTGYIMQAIHVSAPFVIGGSLKIVYDLLLYAVARRVSPRV